MLATLEAILAIAGPLLKQVTDLITGAIAASKSSDQAALDAFHKQAIDLANALRPPGTDPVA